MMKKLLKITKISTLPKSADCQRYRSQILIAQIEDLNIDRSFVIKIMHFFMSKFSLRIPCQEACWNRLGLGVC